MEGSYKNNHTASKAVESLLKLGQFVEKNDYKGWDPFDGMNSSLFQATPFKHWKYTRMAWIQFFKRSPVNFRKLMLVPKQYNTKGLGLFLYGYCELYRLSQKGMLDFGTPQEILKKLVFVADKVIQLQSKGYHGACWGYNFDWQSRVFFQPKYTPTVVATSFVANALFEAYEITKDKTYLNTALSSCDFVTNDLNRTYLEKDRFIFSYSPLDHSEVYNASLLGARLLARGFYYTENALWLDLSSKATACITDLQAEQGSWVYGRKENQQWIDNFHTGFNLECIFDVMRFTGDETFKDAFDRGMEYYLSVFFAQDGTPRYYHNSTYPVDIHSPAQVLATLTKTGLLQQHHTLAEKVLLYTLDNMQAREGYFYYQIKHFLSSRIPYMRWAQAWMFYALAMYINAQAFKE